LGLSFIIIIASYLLIYKTDFLKSLLSFIGSGLFASSLVLLYMDDFKLSSNNYIKYLQIFSFVATSFIIILLVYNHITSIDIINYVKDGDNNIHLHGHVSIDKEAGKAIGQGLGQGISTIGSQ
jgi:hypothetical protein